MKKKMTIDEHRAVAARLRAIRAAFDVDVLNRFKLSSETFRRMWRVNKRIDHLRCALDGDLYQHRDSVDRRLLAAIYYGRHDPIDDKPDIDGAFGILRDVGTMIGGRAPAPVMAEYRRLDRAVRSLRAAIVGRPDDVRRRARASAMAEAENLE